MSEVANLASSIDSLIGLDKISPHDKILLESYRGILGTFIGKYIKKTAKTKVILKQEVIVELSLFQEEFSKIAKDAGHLKINQKVLDLLFTEIKRQPICQYLENNDDEDMFQCPSDCIVEIHLNHIKIIY